MELNDAGAQAHGDHTGRQFAEMIVDRFEELLEQPQPQGRAPARTPPDAAARTFRMIRRPSRRTCSRGTFRAW
jgi:hypothetical protein